MNEPVPAVFISCHRKDRDSKDRLVTQLQVLGFDRSLDVRSSLEIAAGDDRLQRIEDAIDGARIAVLLISADYLASDSIRARELCRIHARHARTGLRVIPLIVRPCEWQKVEELAGIQEWPEGGRALSAGDEHQVETDLSELAGEIHVLLGGKPGQRPPAGAAGRQPWISPLLWLLLPTIAALLLTVIASSWRMATRVQVELTTRRLAFTAGGTEPLEVLEVSVPFSSLVIERCEVLAFTPAELAVRDPANAEPTWRPLTPVDSEVRLACRDPDAKLTLRAPEPAPERSLGSLDRIWVKADSEVVLEVRTAPEIGGEREIELTAGVDLARPLTLGAREEILIDAEFVELEGVEDPPTGDFLTYRARLEASRRSLDLRSRRGLTLIVVPPTRATEGLFVSTRIPIKSVEFLELDIDGEFISPLLAEARLSYPEFPDLPAVTVPDDQLLGIGELGKAQLERLELDAEGPGLRLRFDGVAGKARSTDRAFSTDYRLTVWDDIAHSALWKRLAAVAVWVLSTAWLGFEAWKKLRGGRD